MAASVWITWGTRPDSSPIAPGFSRMAETIPWVTVNSSPKGFPMAMAFCPTRIWSESPQDQGHQALLGGVHLEEGHVQGRGRPHQPGLVLLGVVVELHRDPVRPLHHVVVGEDVPLLVNDEARARAPLGRHLEEGGEELKPRGKLDALRPGDHGDVDHPVPVALHDLHGVPLVLQKPPRRRPWPPGSLGPGRWRPPTRAPPPPSGRAPESPQRNVPGSCHTSQFHPTPPG